MAAGKPIVSTAVPDVIRNFTPIVNVAYSHDEFIAGIRETLRHPDPKLIAQGIECASAASWESIVAAMRMHILDALPAPYVVTGDASAMEYVPRRRRRVSLHERLRDPPSLPVCRRPHFQLTLPGGGPLQMTRKTDVLVVGAGFSGAVVAERLAAHGMSVLVIDKRPHIGGNVYDVLDKHGVLIHPYGPHIFHTNGDRIASYLSRFTSWRPYEHRVLAKVGEQFVRFQSTSTPSIACMASTSMRHQSRRSTTACASPATPSRPAKTS